jgi:hypothetical protein
VSRLVRRASLRGHCGDETDRRCRPRREPLLIGPPCAGKSTLARLLAERSGRRVVCLDALRHTLLPILGCDLERAEALSRAGDHAQWCRYVRPFEHRMLEWVLGERSDVVFDVGAGHVLPLDAPQGRFALAASLADCLAGFAAIVHVTPSREVGAIERHCLDRLIRRHGAPPAGDDWMFDVAAYYARRTASYASLATFEVLTEQEAPLRTVERIEGFLSGLDPDRSIRPPIHRRAPGTG